MTADWVQSFIDALHGLEDDQDLQPMLAQFTDDIRLRNLVHEQPLDGPEGARRFWQGYRDQFGRIHSAFERVLVADDQAALEWHAEGTLSQGGREVSYRGVTLLKRGEGGIAEFTSYYDPQPFLESLGVTTKQAA